MTDSARQVAMKRHAERQELMAEVKKMVAAFGHLTKVDLFPPTLKQVALFLRYTKTLKKEYRRLMEDLQKSLTYRQGKEILGDQADPRIENWKSTSGRTAAEVMRDLGIK